MFMPSMATSAMIIPASTLPDVVAGSRVGAQRLDVVASRDEHRIER